MKSPNPSGSPSPASPFPVENSAQAARPGRNTARIPPGHIGSFAESATEKGSGERIRRFMNSSGYAKLCRQLRGKMARANRKMTDGSRHYSIQIDRHLA